MGNVSNSKFMVWKSSGHEKVCREDWSTIISNIFDKTAVTKIQIDEF